VNAKRVIFEKVDLCGKKKKKREKRREHMANSNDEVNMINRSCNIYLNQCNIISYNYNVQLKNELNYYNI